MAQPAAFSAITEPASTRKGLFEVDSILATSVSTWLKKRGKVLRPKLSEEQRKQLAECFSLMDADGSGAIDAEELGNAFKLLGLNIKKSELVAMLDEVDRDGSGEVEYLEFVEIMTTTLHKLAEEKEQEGSNQNNQAQAQVPFALMATAYRRKRIMESLISGDKDMTAQIAQMGENKRWEEEEEENAARARAQEAANAKAKRDGSKDGVDRLVSASIAHSLARLKAGIGQSRVLSGLLTDQDDDEEKELTLLLRQRTKERLDAKAATELATQQLMQHANFRESPSHKMLMSQLEVPIPKVRLPTDGRSSSPVASRSRNASRHHLASTPTTAGGTTTAGGNASSLSRASTSLSRQSSGASDSAPSPRDQLESPSRQLAGAASVPLGRRSMAKSVPGSPSPNATEGLSRSKSAGAGLLDEVPEVGCEGEQPCTASDGACSSTTTVASARGGVGGSSGIAAGGSSSGAALPGLPMDSTAMQELQTMAPPQRSQHARISGLGFFADVSSSGNRASSRAASPAGFAPWRAHSPIRPAVTFGAPAQQAGAARCNSPPVRAVSCIPDPSQTLPVRAQTGFKGGLPAGAARMIAQAVQSRLHIH